MSDGWICSSFHPGPAGMEIKWFSPRMMRVCPCQNVCCSVSRKGISSSHRAFTNPGEGSIGDTNSSTSSTSFLHTGVKIKGDTLLADIRCLKSFLTTVLHLSISVHLILNQRSRKNHPGRAGPGHQNSKWRGGYLQLVSTGIGYTFDIKTALVLD